MKCAVPNGGRSRPMAKFGHCRRLGPTANAPPRRPQLRAALEACRKQKATLLIAKLDRLARNVHFVSGLMESGVEFVAVDMPMANRLTVHILAAVAEHEREMISQRTKAALAAAKARGTKLGNPNGARPLRGRGNAPAITPGQAVDDAATARVLPYGT